jgi:hypothetical protein
MSTSFMRVIAGIGALFFIYLALGATLDQKTVDSISKNSPNPMLSYAVLYGLAVAVVVTFIAVVLPKRQQKASDLVATEFANKPEAVRAFWTRRSSRSRHH